MLSNEPEPWQADLVRIVWSETYGRTDAPPPVLWVFDAWTEEGEVLNCGGGDAFIHGTACAGGSAQEKSAGLGYEWQIYVAKSPHVEVMRHRLAHELTHAACDSQAAAHPVECFGEDELGGMLGVALERIGWRR